jgi:hypothetical protein
MTFKTLSKSEPTINTNIVSFHHLGCESPSLPRGSIHIVVAGYKYNQDDAGIRFGPDNYLFDLRLTNADIYWYRRVQPQQPLAPPMQGPCGMTLFERLLLPNYGREGAAFINHVLEIYDQPSIPKSIVFLHGHAAASRHTSCDAVFSRSTLVYRDLANKRGSLWNNSTHNHFSVQNHMMTLTSSIHGTKHFRPFTWYGMDEPNAPRVLPEEVLMADSIGELQKTPCWLFQQRWKHIINVTLSPLRQFQSSCCASFLLPGHRIRRFPRAFYQDWLSVLTDESQPDQGRECFEYVVYTWFGDEQELLTSEHIIDDFYKAANGLIYYANEHNETHVNGRTFVDSTVVNRMTRCKAASQETIEQFEKKQKWNNQWKRFHGAVSNGMELPKISLNTTT